MNKKKIISLLTVAATISTVLGVIYQGYVHFRDNKEYEADTAVIAEGEKLNEEYDNLNQRHWNKEITNSEFSAGLKELVPQYESYLEKFDNHKWGKDLARDAILHRQLMVLYLDTIHKMLEIYSE